MPSNPDCSKSMMAWRRRILVSVKRLGVWEVMVSTFSMFFRSLTRCSTTKNLEKGKGFGNRVFEFNFQYVVLGSWWHARDTWRMMTRSSDMSFRKRLQQIKDLWNWRVKLMRGSSIWGVGSNRLCTKTFLQLGSRKLPLSKCPFRGWSMVYPLLIEAVSFNLKRLGSVQWWTVCTF